MEIDLETLLERMESGDLGRFHFLVEEACERWGRARELLPRLKLALESRKADVILLATSLIYRMSDDREILVEPLVGLVERERAGELREAAEGQLEALSPLPREAVLRLARRLPEVKDNLRGLGSLLRPLAASPPLPGEAARHLRANLPYYQQLAYESRLAEAQVVVDKVKELVPARPKWPALVALLLLCLVSGATFMRAPVSRPEPPHQCPAERKGFVDVTTPGLTLKPGARLYGVSGGYYGTIVSIEDSIIKVNQGPGSSSSGGLPPPKVWFVDLNDPALRAR